MGAKISGIASNLLTIVGVLYEFFLHGSVNYKAVNDFIKEYFCPSIAGTFAVIGVLLIDRDHDGVPDKWQEEGKEDAERNSSKQIRP